MMSNLSSEFDISTNEESLLILFIERLLISLILKLRNFIFDLILFFSNSSSVISG